MKFKHGRRRSFEYIFCKLYFQVATDVAVACIEKHSEILLTELFTAILFIFRIIAIALFVFLAIEPAKKLIHLLRLSIQTTFVFLVKKLRMQPITADE